jgi:hypothetical protein
VGILRHLAIRAAVQGEALSGADPNGLLAFGGQLGYTVGGGVTLAQTVDRFALGVSMDVSYGTDYAFNVLTAISESLEANAITPDTLLDKTQVTRYAPGAQVAIGLHPAVGLWVGGEYVAFKAKADGVADTGHTIAGGGGLSVDFSRISPVPLGLTGSYRAEHVPDEPLHSQFAAGLGYTGRRDVSIGIESVVMKESHPEDKIDLLVVVAAMRVRYYW